MHLKGARNDIQSFYIYKYQHYQSINRNILYIYVRLIERGVFNDIQTMTDVNIINTY